jgi:hypothetical protein
MEKASAQRKGAKKAKVTIRRSDQGKGARRMPPEHEKQGIDDPLVYEPIGPDHHSVISGRRQRPDDFLVAQIKKKITASGLTRRDLYAFVGSGPESLFKDNNAAYNLEYGLRDRPTITMECARRWMSVMGSRMGVFFQSAEGGWHDALLELRDAVLEGRDLTVEEYVELAKRALPPDPDDCAIMEGE